MVFGVTSFDELNKMVGMKRSEPFVDFFAPMKLSKERKSKRIYLAELFDDEFCYMMSYMFYAYPVLNDEMVMEMQRRYMNALVEFGILAGVASEEYRIQAAKFAADAIAATSRHKDDPYYYSEDRARLMAEDQSNFINDIKDLEDAVADGYAYKTWETVGDNRVRATHAEIEGLTIPIEEPFELAGGLMMGPHDESLGVDDSEVVMCRCSLSFS